MKWTKEQWENQYNETINSLNKHISKADEKMCEEQKLIDLHSENKRHWRKFKIEFELLKDMIIENYEFVNANPSKFFIPKPTTHNQNERQ